MSFKKTKEVKRALKRYLGTEHLEMSELRLLEILYTKYNLTLVHKAINYLTRRKFRIILVLNQYVAQRLMIQKIRKTLNKKTLER